MPWLKSRERRNREMAAIGAIMVTRKAPSTRVSTSVRREPVLRKLVGPTASPASGPQTIPTTLPSALRPTGFYAPAQAPGGLTATGPQAEGQSAATALTESDMWSLYTQALSAREKELLDTDSENPWVTKRYLSAIERLKRDEFGDTLLQEEQALWRESYVNQFGFDDAQQWAYDKAHGGTRWGPRSMGGGYDTFGGKNKLDWFKQGAKAWYTSSVAYIPKRGSWQRAAYERGVWFAQHNPESRREWSAFGVMTSPNWAPGEELQEALMEANPNVYNFTYGTQNTARFGDEVVPHLCETQWGESDARCIQHLDDPYWSGR